MSSVPLVYPRLFIQGQLQRVTNSYLRCKHEVQLVSGPDYQTLLASSDFVSTARGASEHCVVETSSRQTNKFFRFRVRTDGAGLARLTLGIAFPPRAKEHVTNCKPPIHLTNRGVVRLIPPSRAFPQLYSRLEVCFVEPEVDGRFADPQIDSWCQACWASGVAHR